MERTRVQNTGVKWLFTAGLRNPRCLCDLTAVALSRGSVLWSVLPSVCLSREPTSLPACSAAWLTQGEPGVPSAFPVAKQGAGGLEVVQPFPQENALSSVFGALS